MVAWKKHNIPFQAGQILKMAGRAYPWTTKIHECISVDFQVSINKDPSGSGLSKKRLICTFTLAKKIKYVPTYEHKTNWHDWVFNKDLFIIRTFVVKYLSNSNKYSLKLKPQTTSVRIFQKIRTILHKVTLENPRSNDYN